MSQTVVWAADLDTTALIHRATGLHEAAGGCKRLYFGRTGTPASGTDYGAYLRFALNWTGVGKIVSAVLTLYTDDGFGILGAFTAPTETPTITIRRLTGAFSEHTASAIFTAADNTSAAASTSGLLSGVVLAADPLGVTHVDLTAMVEQWAPGSVLKRNGTPGGKATNYGIGLYGDASVAHNGSVISREAEAGVAAYKPIITLTYDLGVTVPDVPTNLVPAGAVTAVASFAGDFTDAKAGDQLRYSEVEVYTSAATNVGQTVSGGTRIYARKQAESDAAILTARFDHIPTNLHLTTGTTYKWRARVTDQEAQVSLWTDLVSFSVTNNNPAAPTLTPASASSFASLDGVQFRGGTFSDPDAGDTLLAYQVEMSAYPEGSAAWDDPTFLLWESGKTYVAAASTSWQTPYGGTSLLAATYYWRARQWDNHQGVSDWSYASIILTADFIVDPGGSTNTIQQRPKAPWRIVIKGMNVDGLRGPGDIVAVIEDAENTGASILYNSPGELHFTLPIFHPQISVIEPKQTHYSVQFRQGDGWREVYAGLMWDFDAGDNDIVFYGIDYLALLDYIEDEHYDPANIDLDYTLGGSKYSSVSIHNIVVDQLNRARTIANSPVGFIGMGTIAAMGETLTVFSTYQPTLNFIVGLLDSHRAGANKRTRLSVQQGTGGTYNFVVQDDPGVTRDNLRLRYGEFVQGFRVIPFGVNWASRINAVGRERDGLKVRYFTREGPGIDEAVWGHFAQAQFLDNIEDANDFERRVRQLATKASKLGQQVGLGLRTAFLQPRDGYELLDQFPVEIEYGPISTAAFGSGYWVAVGITWTALQRGDSNTTLTLLPREDTTPPDDDLLIAQPISTQGEWQVGWVPPPSTLVPTSLFYLNLATGGVYARTAGAVINSGITGTGNTITAVAHGLVAADAIRFGNILPTNSGIDEQVTYYVLAAGLTADAFRFSLTIGGTAITLTHAVTAGVLRRPDFYSPVPGVQPWQVAPAPPGTHPGMVFFFSG